MTTDPGTTAWLEQEHTWLAQTVRTHRVAVQYVMGGEEPDEPPFACTVRFFGWAVPNWSPWGWTTGPRAACSTRSPTSVFGGRDLVPGEVITDDGLSVRISRGRARGAAWRRVRWP